MITRTLIAAVFPLCTLLAGCSSLSGGAGDETTNGMVMGTVIDQTGAVAADVQVKLYPVNHDPVKQASVIPVDTTDDSGGYVFTRNNPGYYTVQAVHLYDRTRALVSGIYLAGDRLVVPAVMLLKPGAIKVVLQGSVDTVNGYLYIPGTGISADLAGASDSVIIDSVPAGMVPGIYYSTRGGTGYTVLRYNVPVPSGDTVVIANPLWRFSRRLYLNTTMTGAAVTGDVANFPVLIRLTDGNFIFSQAQSNGADIRFTKTDNAPLPYEIERWDTENRQAEVWVKVDTVYGNDSTQTIMMYWGNPDAVGASSSVRVFDTASGFQGVWHLNEGGNDPARDATANHFAGIAYHMSHNTELSGAIGKARVFDGDSSYITMPNTASGKLNFPEDGYFTISAWVYADTFDNIYRTIAAKGFNQYFLWITYIPSNEPLWEFSDFTQIDNWQQSNMPATEKQWVLLTGVRQGSSQYLYCNGELVAGISATYSWGIDRDTSNDFSIGRFLKEATFPAKFGWCCFKGRIDEVRVSSVVRNPDWIRLSYMNQRGDDKLVQFK